MALKQILAARLVARFAGAEAAEAAAAHFRRVVQKREVPEDVPQFRMALGSEDGLGLLDLLRRLEFTQSNAEGRRLIQQGAVQVNGKGIQEATERLGKGSHLIQAGKRRFAQVEIS